MTTRRLTTNLILAMASIRIRKTPKPLMRTLKTLLLSRMKRPIPTGLKHRSRQATKIAVENVLVDADDAGEAVEANPVRRDTVPSRRVLESEMGILDRKNRIDLRREKSGAEPKIPQRLKEPTAARMRTPVPTRVAILKIPRSVLDGVAEDVVVLGQKAAVRDSRRNI
jgi:hypothetical protein